MRLGSVPFRSAYTPGRRQPCSELGRKLYFLHFTMTRPFIPAHGGFVNDCHLRAINSAALCFSLTWESTPLPTPPSFSGISCALAPSAPAAPLEQGVCHPPGPPNAHSACLPSWLTSSPGATPFSSSALSASCFLCGAPNLQSGSPTLLSSLGLEAQPPCRRSCLHPSRS